MGRLRVSLSTLMAVVVVMAGDAAILRSLYRSQGSGLPALFQARALLLLGVLPLASLLFLMALVMVPKLIRTGSRASFFLGFEVGGWAALLGFVMLNSLVPTQVGSYVEIGMVLFGRMIAWIALPIAPLLRGAPIWVDSLLEEVFDCGSCASIVGVPQLGIALLGGWLAGRVGISIRIETRPTHGDPSDPAELPPITA